ncbi:NAD(P)/FAD-dependent oxidoreductase [Brachybacterium hainanense]|uniref:NAD(P)/FAD-dependent oxidoreductase n=1 Tax=Brachybacterium hainanense TaxID=1541174 RepID=A0ABV6RC27_9MICO
MSRIVGAEALPAEVREYCGLDRIDFADQVSVTGVPCRSAEQWARATVGIVHPVAGTLIWRVGLHGRLDHRRSPDLIGGWRVAHRDERRIRLEIPSTVMSLRLMLTTEDDRVTLTTCVRFDAPRGKAAWKTIEPLHGLGDPRLLAGAARKERDRELQGVADPDSKPSGERVVVLGAGYSGLLAARSLARHLPESARLTLINERDVFVERMRMHQLVAGQDLPRIPLSDSMRSTGAEVAIGSVASLDRDGRAVVLDDGRRIGYDRLVYALGSRSTPAPQGSVGVADPDGAATLRHRLGELRGGRVVVVGGGLTGVETASEIAEQRPELEVHLLSGGPVDAGMAPRAGRRLRESLSRLGVAVREGVQVAPDGSGALQIESAGTAEPLSADLAIWAAGFRASPIAEDAGLRVDGQRRIVVDDRLRSVDDPRIYAIGDAGVIGRPKGLARMSCQTAVVMASWLGKRLAREVAGRPMPAHRPKFVWRNISLGRGDGLTQFTHFDDRPLPFFLHGKAAASFKELVNRFVAWEVTGLRPSSGRGRR